MLKKENILAKENRKALHLVGWPTLGLIISGVLSLTGVDLRPVVQEQYQVNETAHKNEHQKFAQDIRNAKKEALEAKIENIDAQLLQIEIAEIHLQAEGLVLNDHLIALRRNLLNQKADLERELDDDG